MRINLGGVESVELVGKIHKVLDRTEWDSDTAVEIAELLDAYGVEVREPNADRTYWVGADVEYAAQNIDHFRICVWEDTRVTGGGFMGVQLWNQDLKYESGSDIDPFTVFYMKVDPEFDLDEMLDQAIEKWETMR